MNIEQLSLSVKGKLRTAMLMYKDFCLVQTSGMYHTGFNDPPSLYIQ